MDTFLAPGVDEDDPDGHHVCLTPPPGHEGQTWTCPECGTEYVARKELRFKPKLGAIPLFHQGVDDGG